MFASFSQQFRINEGSQHYLRIYSSSLCCIACISLCRFVLAMTECWNSCFVIKCVWGVQYIYLCIPDTCHIHLLDLHRLLSCYFPSPLPPSISPCVSSSPLTVISFTLPLSPPPFLLLLLFLPWALGVSDGTLSEKIYLWSATKNPHRDKHTLWKTNLVRERDPDILERTIDKCVVTRKRQTYAEKCGLTNRALLPVAIFSRLCWCVWTCVCAAWLFL